MKKGKAISLLTIISVITAFLLVMTFIRFPVGIKNYNGFLGAVQLDYDIGGGYAYTLTLSEDNNEEVKDINEVKQTIEQRLEILGYTTFVVKPYKSTDTAVKDYQIRIEARPSVTTWGELDINQLNSDVAAVAAYGQVKFYGGESANPTTEILTDVNVIEDAYVAGSSINQDGTTSYNVAITLTQQAYDYLIAEIEEHSGSYYLSVKLDETELLSGASALDKNHIVNRVLGVSSTSEASAKIFAMQIKSGGLAYKYTIDSSVAISSPYGENVYNKSMIGIYALNIAIIIALIVLFRGYGIGASYSMIIFILFEIIMLIAVPGIKLSIGGVFGIILSTIIAANGFTITARKISEEYAKGKTVKSAIKTAYSRSLKPILASGIVSGVIGLLSLIFLSGTAKCFGITLGIGAILGVIVNLLIGRLLTAIFLPLVKNKEKFLNLKREDK